MARQGGQTWFQSRLGYSPAASLGAEDILLSSSCSYCDGFLSGGGVTTGGWFILWVGGLPAALSAVEQHLGLYPLGARGSPQLWDKRNLPRHCPWPQEDRLAPRGQPPHIRQVIRGPSFWTGRGPATKACARRAAACPWESPWAPSASWA